MFGPFLDEPSKGKEIEEARVDIGNGIRALIIIVEMMQFFYDKLFHIVPQLGFIPLRTEVEDVRIWFIGMLEDAEIFDTGIVLIGDDCDLFVEGSVVARDVDLY